MLLGWVAGSGSERGFICGEGLDTSFDRKIAGIARVFTGFFGSLVLSCGSLIPSGWSRLLVTAIERVLPVWVRVVAGRGHRRSGF
jgi:hypothetical protein